MRERLVRELYAATALTWVVGLTLWAGRGSRRAPLVGGILMAGAVLVLLPCAVTASVAANRRRIAERLGVTDLRPSAGLPDEHLGAGRTGGEQG